MEIIFLVITMTVITVVSGSNYQTERAERELKMYSMCLDNSETNEDKRLCQDLFTD